MAYVKILNLKSKGGIKNASNYIKNEDKTDAENRTKFLEGVEIGSEKRSIPEAISNVVSYTENGEKTKEKHLVTGINCKPDTAAEEMRQTVDYWKQVKGKRG